MANEPPFDSPMACATCGEPAACYHIDGRPFCAAHCALGHTVGPPFISTAIPPTRCPKCGGPLVDVDDWRGQWACRSCRLWIGVSSDAR